MPRQPGLYAFYGDDRAWSDLGLSTAFDDQPLYVGKAERSLNGRYVGTHFAAGKTGSSTVRRSLAALLLNHLALVAVPRNLAKPDGSANFGLDVASEVRLSDWMEHRLSLSTWSKPEDVVLDEIETSRRASTTADANSRQGRGAPTATSGGQEARGRYGENLATER